MTEKLIKFLAPKGQCPAGHVGKYPSRVADPLIKNGIAEEYKPAPKKITKKEKEMTSNE